MHKLNIIQKVNSCEGNCKSIKKATFEWLLSYNSVLTWYVILFINLNNPINSTIYVMLNCFRSAINRLLAGKDRGRGKTWDGGVSWESILPIKYSAKNIIRKKNIKKEVDSRHRRGFCPRLAKTSFRRLRAKERTTFAFA